MHAQVRLLVEGGAPLGNADDEGLTPLHLAAYSGKLEERLYIRGQSAVIMPKTTI